MVKPFGEIRARAEARKGGADALVALLGPEPDNTTLASVPDDRVLAAMAKRIFAAGFAWSVIENKWSGFEDAFLGFEPKRLLFQPDDFWGELSSDARIVRHAAKIKAVRDNAAFILRISGEHGSFGRFLADWPAADQNGLTDWLAQNGSRLGGHTGPYLLRFLGWDTFILWSDVVAALRDAGLDVAKNPTSKKDRATIQAQINGWAAETGLPRSHISRILALSIGENRIPA